MITDGYGLNDVESNAGRANTPVMDSLMKVSFVHGNASGMAVGLPKVRWVTLR